ncbi:HlyD family efflux transporter periplasmic adaptor subunit [Nonomuraea phyllanthi]|uniref:HlyD family efflux transporter periplasmic adaptor subunit n=1 Tax=Nonomuraea phyllanthi TaxID=2219224 RepID=A0A5C4WJK4_9ACTN|nr:peptidoglycan-binding protein [Nonomuraea phyllanthi]KAB8193982.1 HlyD family efflux transporter periplasmic adaptor subunit [Nonomuraea phyllanthi]QFY07583.1 HlyD family efflux transporter periplasmic adaptor subunit [Nonomuraea phyllanthi]
MNGALKGVVAALGTVVVGSAVTAGGVFASAALFDTGPQAKPAPTPTARPVGAATKEITRGDLVDEESVDGKLTYADGRTIKAASGGTITALPAEGSVIKRGKRLYAVDRRPRILMYGKLPAYRTLKDGVKKGPDVKQLERNLRSLGFARGVTVDNRFTDATERAVKRWQKKNGMERTGKVTPSDVVFLPEEVRVSATKVDVGDQIGALRPILDITGTDRLVRINLDADKQDIAKKGRTVTVKLASGKSVKGKISRVAKVAKPAKSSGNQEKGATVEVEIKVTAKSLGALDEAPVTVELTRQRAEDVLTVPVEALLALPEGGYGVEVVDQSGARRVPVKTGAFGNGRVEVTGTGLAEGMKVTVSGR